MTFNLVDIGIQEADLDGTMSQMVGDKFDIKEFGNKILTFLVSKAEVVSGPEEI